MTPPWDRCSYTVLVDSTVPICRPARWATLVATSDAVLWVYDSVRRPRNNRLAWSYPRITV